MSLIERVDMEAQAKQAKSIRRITIKVGALSGVEAELLAQAYEIARTGTSCEHAELVVTREPARWACPNCQTTLDHARSLCCPACDAAGQLVAGGDLLLQQMEIEI